MKRRGIIIYVLLVLILTGGMSYVGPGYNPILSGRLLKFTYFVIIGVVLLYWNTLPKTRLLKSCMWLMFFQLLSMFGAYAIHGQTFSQSFPVTIYAFTYLMFPMMYILRLEEKQLIRLFFIFGIFWTAAMFIEQFTYPSMLFCSSTYFNDYIEKGAVSQRNGIYRLGIAGTTFGLLMLFYSFQKYLERAWVKYLIYIAIGITGVYLTCTRQVMAAAAGCLLVGLWLKGKLKLGVMIGLLVIGFTIYQFSDVLFEDYVELTEKNAEEKDDYIRFVAYEYYGVEYNKGNILAILIGNGAAKTGSSYAASASAYGKEIEKLEKVFGLYRVDVGLVGDYSYNGIIYVIIILSIFYYVFKNRRYISLYLQLYMLYVLVTSVMLMHFMCAAGTYQVILALYLIDRQISQNKRIENQQEIE